MKSIWRLDSKAPDLAEAIRAASPERQRKAARIACELAAQIVGLEGEAVEQALRALREGRTGDAALLNRLTSMSDQYDDEYLRLAEADDKVKQREAQHLFSQARAVSGLALALSGDVTQMHEAIYEALSSVFEDATVVERAVESALRGDAFAEGAEAG